MLFSFLLFNTGSFPAFVGVLTKKVVGQKDQQRQIILP